MGLGVVVSCICIVKMKRCLQMADIFEAALDAKHAKEGLNADGHCRHLTVQLNAGLGWCNQLQKGKEYEDGKEEDLIHREEKEKERRREDKEDKIRRNKKKIITMKKNKRVLYEILFGHSNIMKNYSFVIYADQPPREKISRCLALLHMK